MKHLHLSIKKPSLLTLIFTHKTYFSTPKKIGEIKFSDNLLGLLIEFTKRFNYFCPTHHKASNYLFTKDEQLYCYYLMFQFTARLRNAARMIS